MDKFSGKPGENDFEVWIEDFQEATADCGRDDQQQVQWFFWFLGGPAKVTWQRTLMREDKESWTKILVYRGQYRVHLDPYTALDKFKNC